MRYLVTADNGMESGLLDTQEQADRWINDNLPIGIQKCRTGCYYISKGDECKTCGDFVEENEECYCNCKFAGKP